MYILLSLLFFNQLVHRIIIYFLTFMKTSTSGSGLMLASFSLLDNSANMSVKCQDFLEL